MFVSQQITTVPKVHPCAPALWESTLPKPSQVDPARRVRTYKPPGELLRALYIPRHHSGTAHLPLYDVADQYENTVKGSEFGSNLYSMQLSQIAKPRGDGMDAAVDYLVDMNTIPDFQNNYQLNVQRRTLSYSHDSSVKVVIPSPPDGRCTLLTASTNPFDDCSDRSMAMTTSYPLSPSIRGDYLIPHPYFTFRLPGLANEPERHVQWQVHPAPNNLFRYTLVDLGPASEEPNYSHDPADHQVLAIYDHVGIVVWLPTDYSEGILLLREGGNYVQEATIVASLLAVLWQIREVKHMRPKRQRSNSASSKLLKKMASLVRN
ncbi:hypothetical protein BDV59DRAFT_176 [Aspergillus ambiguus]|uniref:uncharacterized protein n=1 Tax=Aspergillus ambiguus TaxID=176160 RepID=UPI003CCD6BAE